MKTANNSPESQKRLTDLGIKVLDGKSVPSFGKSPAGYLDRGRDFSVDEVCYFLDLGSGMEGPIETRETNRGVKASLFRNDESGIQFWWGATD